MDSESVRPPTREVAELVCRALEGAALAVAITDARGTIQWVNHAYSRLTGRPPREALGRQHWDLDASPENSLLHERLWDAARAGQVWRGEIYGQRPNGARYVEEQTVTPFCFEPGGPISHFICVRQDVTERRRQDERLAHLATHDPLTGLLNRQALAEHLERWVQRALRGAAVAILVVNADHFKLVNGLVGHQGGDLVLRALARLLKAATRSTDVLARLGGDEFAVLLDGAPVAEAERVAERLRCTVEEHRFRAVGNVVDLTVSIGLTVPDGKSNGQQALALAEAAMHTAKAAGGNRWVRHLPEDRPQLVDEGTRWISRIKDALRDDGLVLHFQPVVRLAGGQPQYHEALVRLRLEDGRLAPPGAFLPVAERYGLMAQVDRWVLGRALGLLVARPTLHLFVNLSGVSLSDESLLEDVESRLRAARHLAGRLCLEVTETAAVADVSATQRWMRRLKEVGCRFALDDFGTGFSTFAYLRALPVDYVKIDGSFVRDLETDSTSRSLVQAINSVAHTLGKETVAEWVESPSVAALLRDLGTEYGQGYHWGPPGPSAP